MERLAYTTTETLLWDFSETEEYYVLVVPPALEVRTLFKVTPYYAFKWFGLAGGTNLRIIYYPFSQTRFRSLTDPCHCPPVITLVSPNIGVIGSGVTIGGRLFTGITDATFGGISTSFIFVDDNTITATVPTGTGVVDIVVTATGGTSEITPADEFTYTLPATVCITAFSTTVFSHASYLGQQVFSMECIDIPPEGTLFSPLVFSSTVFSM